MTGTEDDYEVGYGRPPRHSRFRPGQSGNPRGRPNGSRNFASDLDRLLMAKITVNRDGKPRKVTTQEAALLRLGERALKGDPRALLRLLDLAQRRSEEREERSAERHLSANEEAILSRFEEEVRLKLVAGTSQDGGGDDEPA
jgi:hypothetical protein